MSKLAVKCVQNITRCIYLKSHGIKPFVVFSLGSIQTRFSSSSYEASRLIPGPEMPGKWLVGIVVSLTPTANNIMVQVPTEGVEGWSPREG